MGGKRKPAAKPQPSTERKSAWEREQFSVRLTDVRRDCLRLISDAMPTGSTPNDAFDRALEIALSKADPEPAASPDVLARLGDLEELVATMAREREADAAAHRAIAAETLDRVRSVAALISAVAAMPAADSDDVGDAGIADAEDISNGARAEAVVSLRSWLDRRAHGIQSVNCLGRWHAKSRQGDRLVAMDFEIAEAGQASARSIVRIEPVDAASPLGKLDQAGPISLACARRSGGGWIVAIHRIEADRSRGGLVCEIRA